MNGGGMELLSDQDLMNEIGNKNPEALRELYNRHEFLLKGTMLKVIHNEYEVDDVLQEVLLQIWNKSENYCPHKGSPVSWLVTLARRRAIDRLRQQVAYKRVTSSLEIRTKNEQTFKSRDITSYAVQKNDVKQQLNKLLDRLPVLQKEAVSLAFLYGLTQRQISAQRRIPLGTVKTRIELGLKKLSHYASILKEEI